MKARTLAIGVALLAGAGVLFFWPRQVLGPEAEIRALFGRFVKAAEDRKLGVIADAMAPGFKARGAGKDEVKQMLAYQLLRDRETVAVLNPSLTVELKSDSQATLAAELLFARQKGAGPETVAPESVVAAYHLDATLERTEEGWRFVSADYRQH